MKKRLDHGWEHLSFKEGGEVFSCKVVALQNTNGQEVNLSVGLSGIAVPCNLLIFCRSQVHSKNLQLHVDENECRMQSYLYAYANAHEMLM